MAAQNEKIVRLEERTAASEARMAEIAAIKVKQAQIDESIRALTAAAGQRGAGGAAGTLTRMLIVELITSFTA